MTGTRGTAGLGAILLALPGTASAAVPLSEVAAEVPAAASVSQRPLSTDPQLRTAEDAVLSNLQHPPSRLALGAAYLAAGRFQSAEQALNDALLLDPDAAGANMRLVLVQIALGKKADALARLSAMKTAGREADIGLALALAGDIERARGVLSDAARDDRATPRLRQNLAFVEALAGNWASAVAIAAQDVPPEQMADRLRRWATIVQLRDTPALQLGALVGVLPQADPGMPLALALADRTTETAAFASSNALTPSQPSADALPEPQQEPVRPAAYTGPPRMRGVRSGEADMGSPPLVATPVRTGGRSLYRAGSRRGMTVSTRANRFPVRLVAVCASDATPVLGRGRLQKISFSGSPRRIRKAGPERSA